MLPPSSAQPWPPESWRPFASDIAMWDDWYAGRNLDGRTGTEGKGRNKVQRAFDRATGTSHQQTNAAATVERRVHVPAAADIAATGADLLFGSPPVFKIPEAHEERDLDEAGKELPPSAEMQAALDAEARLLELTQDDGWSSTLIEGAEISGALGGVFLRPVVDLDIVQRPILTVVHPDQAVPVFRFGYLVQVTFWRQFAGGKGKVWRHLEEHGRGYIEHALYLGTPEELGERVDLGARDETRGLITDDSLPYGGGLVDLKSAGIDKLLPVYVPNALPNRQHRTEPVGRSDYADCNDLLDALDEVWTSWVRDIRLAKARLIVPDEFLDNGPRGQGATFNMDREIFTPLAIDPAHETTSITSVQFDIRTADHAATAEALFHQIVTTSGYSPESFGLEGNGAAMTATEVNAKEGRSDQTTGRKQNHWQRGLEDVSESMLMLDKAYCDGTAEVYRPAVEYPDSAEADMRDTASTLNLINLAKAASLETKVRLLNPTWTNGQVQAEVARITAENATAVEDPMAGVV